MIPTCRPRQIPPKHNAPWGRAFQKRRKIWRAPFLPHKVFSHFMETSDRSLIALSTPFCQCGENDLQMSQPQLQRQREGAALSSVWEESEPEAELRAGLCLPCCWGRRNSLCSSASPEKGGSILLLHPQQLSATPGWAGTANKHRRVWAIKH